MTGLHEACTPPIGATPPPRMAEHSLCRAMGQIVSRKLKSDRGHEPQRKQERQWREHHADFIAAYNSTIAAEGLPLDEWKSF